MSAVVQMRALHIGNASFAGLSDADKAVACGKDSIGMLKNKQKINK